RAGRLVSASGAAGDAAEYHERVPVVGRRGLLDIGGSTALLPPSPPSLRSGSRARSEIEGHFTGMGIAAPRLTAEVTYVREPWTRRGAWAGAGGRPDAGAERRADQSGGGVARCGGGGGRCSCVRTTTRASVRGCGWGGGSRGTTCSGDQGACPRARQLPCTAPC